MSTYFVMMASSGSAVTIGELIGSGSPRIFTPDSIYVYRLSNALMVTRDFGGTWTNIIPPDMTTAMTMCSQYAGLTPNTVVLGSVSGGYGLRYQPAPEITAWSSGSALPASVAPVDSVSDFSGGINVLTGNSHAGTESRVIVSSGSPPYPMSRSDTGIPSTAVMTDLDLAE